MDKIMKKLNGHDEQFVGINKKLEEHDTQFFGINKKLEEHDKQFDRVIEKLLKHDDDIEFLKENMATKKDLNKISNTLDKLVAMVEKKDQEVTLVSYGMRQLEDRTEVLENDMKRVKPALGLA